MKHTYSTPISWDPIVPYRSIGDPVGNHQPSLPRHLSLQLLDASLGALGAIRLPPLLGLVGKAPVKSTETLDSLCVFFQGKPWFF